MFINIFVIDFCYMHCIWLKIKPNISKHAICHSNLQKQCDVDYVDVLHFLLDEISQ